MPLDGGGTASKPSGTTAVSGATISSSAFNSVIDDIYSIFNTARPIAYGGTGAATAVAANDALDVAGADIATASTINLDNATGPFVKLTGTTTVSTVTLGSGKGRMAYAAGAFQLTASANLIVNGSTSVNYTTAAGDLLVFRGMGSSVVRVWAISPTAWAAITGKPTTLSGYGITDAIKSVKVQVFTSSGTYTPSTGMAYADILCIGGGGGGGGTGSTAGSNTCQGGGGGGGGASFLLGVTAATVGASKTVTIGAAGSAGTAGNNAGGAGGDTSVGTLCVAKGGAGGAGGAGGTAAAGGAGGAASGGTGTVKLSGGNGGKGQYGNSVTVDAAGGMGGASYLAPPTPAVTFQTAGAAAATYGGGGAGAANLNTTNSYAGGAGAAGIVIITEYCTQ